MHDFSCGALFPCLCRGRGASCASYWVYAYDTCIGPPHSAVVILAHHAAARSASHSKRVCCNSRAGRLLRLRAGMPPAAAGGDGAAITTSSSQTVHRHLRHVSPMAGTAQSCREPHRPTSLSLSPTPRRALCSGVVSSVGVPPLRYAPRPRALLPLLGAHPQVPTLPGTHPCAPGFSAVSLARVARTVHTTSDV